MSHTYKGELGTTFHGDQDLVTGKVDIVYHGVLTNVPGIDILDFVADYVRRERISRLETADSPDVLGLKARS